MRSIVAGLAMLGLSGCIALPPLKHPNPELPAAWPGGQGGAFVAADWWKAYGDPVLDALIEEALAHNADIRLAAARIEEARANLGLARADQFPSAQIDANVSRTRITGRGSVPLPAGTPLTNNDYQVNLQAAYEVDLWGRYRSATKAARADLLATEYARDVVRLSLSTAVAQSYFAVRALDARIALARETLENRRQAVALQKQRFDAGVSSELDLRQAEAELAATETSLAILAQEDGLQENFLGVLLGRQPRALVEQRVARGVEFADLKAPPAVPAGLPSELLARRPDLRQAEQNLAAAHARIEEARAALFPSLSLTANLGSESKALSDLFSSPATIWGVGAALAQTVFNAGRTEAAVQAASARQEQTLVSYEQAIRQAFREVLDALVTYRQAREQAEADTRRAGALERALELADLRYRHGISNYLEVLDAQRNLYQARQDSIDARRAQLAAIADLDKALGGGWDRMAGESVGARQPTR